MSTLQILSAELKHLCLQNAFCRRACMPSLLSNFVQRTVTNTDDLL